jgi:hypothetical protein
MFTAAYNAYYWEEHQLAKQQLAFFENKLKKIDDEPCNTANKSIRKKRLELNIYCIRYTYGL